MRITGGKEDDQLMECVQVRFLRGDSVFELRTPNPTGLASDSRAVEIS